MRSIGGLAAIAATVVLAGCGGGTTVPAYDAAKDTSVYSSKLGKPNFDINIPHVFDALITLDDNRKVALYIHKGKGTFEQHYSPTKKAWSKPHLIYKTKTDPCQGVTLKADGDTVAAFFDFNGYCYDGEPPTESITTVATGDLQKWDVSVTKDFDGYSKIKFEDGGSTVGFLYRGKVAKTWHYGKGFTPER